MKNGSNIVYFNIAALLTQIGLEGAEICLAAGKGLISWDIGLLPKQVYGNSIIDNEYHFSYPPGAT